MSRQQFAFYKSFDDVYQDLSDNQKIEFMNTLLDVQFLRIKIEDVVFNDVILKHIWNAQKHSLEKSVKGYLESQKAEKIKDPFLGVYDDNFTPLQTPSEGNHKEVKGKDKEEVKEKDKKLPTKKPKDFLYENDFEQLWKIYNVGDKWAAYKSWHFRKKDYTGEELIKALKFEDTKQFGKRHFSTVLNSDLDEILKATPIKKPHPYESGLL